MIIRTSQVILRSLEPGDSQWLFDLYVSEEIGFRWDLEGQIPTYEEFIRSDGFLHAYILKFAIVDVQSDAPIGVALAGQVDERSNTIQYGTCLMPNVIGRGKGIVATTILCHYLFDWLCFRKIYSYSVDFNYFRFFKRLGLHMRVEACLKEQRYFQGRYWDVRIFSMLREEWECFSRGPASRLLADVQFSD